MARPAVQLAIPVDDLAAARSFFYGDVLGVGLKSFSDESNVSTQ